MTVKRLQYNYAQIDPETGRCVACFTCSYEIPFPDEYIAIPEAKGEYVGKYYHDGLWYEDAAFTIPWDPETA